MLSSVTTTPVSPSRSAAVRRLKFEHLRVWRLSKLVFHETFPLPTPLRPPLRTSTLHQSGNVILFQYAT
jgi:hypothetical protein